MGGVTDLTVSKGIRKVNRTTGEQVEMAMAA